MKLVVVAGLLGTLCVALAACGGGGVSLEKECRQEGAQCTQLRFTWELRNQDGDTLSCSGGTVGVQLVRVGSDQVVEFTAPCPAGELLTTVLPAEGYQLTAVLWDSAGAVVASKTGTTPVPPRDVLIEFVIADGPPPPPPPPTSNLGQRCDAQTPCAHAGDDCIRLWPDVDYGYCSPVCASAPADDPPPTFSEICGDAYDGPFNPTAPQCFIGGGSSGTVPWYCAIFCDIDTECPQGLVCRDGETGLPVEDEFGDGFCS